MRLDATGRDFLQVAVRHHLQAAFRDVIETCGAEPPELSNAQLHVTVSLRPRAVLQCHFSNNRRFRCEIEIPWEEVRGQRIRPETINLTWEASRLYSQAMEDNYVRREVDALRLEFEELRRAAAPVHVIQMAAERLARREQHARDYHRMRGVERVDASYVRERSRIGDAYREIHMRPSRHGRMPTPTYEPTHLWIDEAADIYYGGYNTLNTVGSKEASLKGMALLKANLTAAQLAQYEEKSYFEVKGGKSGKTYRIRHGRQMNIHELDDKGEPVQGLCFLPQGYLVEGDCMLAQKTALELYEDKALKIANKFTVGAGPTQAWSEFVTQTMARPEAQQALAESIAQHNPLLQRLQGAMERRVSEALNEAVYGSGTAGAEGPGGLSQLIAESPADRTVGLVRGDAS